jgi:hypothetical protein
VAAILAPVYLEPDVRHLAAAPDAKVFSFLFLQRMSLANAPYLCADANYTRILLYNSKYCKILPQGYKVLRLF